MDKETKWEVIEMDGTQEIFVLVVASKEDAEAFVAREHAAGNHNEFVLHPLD